MKGKEFWENPGRRDTPVSSMKPDVEPKDGAREPAGVGGRLQREPWPVWASGRDPVQMAFCARRPRPRSQDGNLKKKKKSSAWTSRKNNRPPRVTRLMRQSLNPSNVSFLSGMTESFDFRAEVCIRKL